MTSDSFDGAIRKHLGGVPRLQALAIHVRRNMQLSVILVVPEHELDIASAVGRGRRELRRALPDWDIDTNVIAAQGRDVSEFNDESLRWLIYPSTTS